MKHILVALETHDDTCRLVLEAACEMARTAGAKLRLLHVIPRATDGVESGVDAYARIRAAERDLVVWENEILDEHRDGVLVEIGDAWKGICRVAHGYAPDSVVIGARSVASHATSSLGTTASHEVKNIDRPVVIVRQHHHVSTGEHELNRR
jgi:nucleotide-binding universal stress UspA family protein